MRKVFAAVGAVLAFTGLTAIMLYFVMSPASIGGAVAFAGNVVRGMIIGRHAPPNTALTADIGGIFSGADTNDESAPAPTDTATTTTIITLEASTTTTVVATTDIETTTVTIPTPVAAPAPNPSLPIIERPEAPDLPEATTTITVTPTAPVQNISSNAPQPQNLPQGGIALPFDEKNFASDDRWQTVWGVQNITSDGALSLSAGPTSVGGSMHFTGGSWTNYLMNTTLDFVGGKTFSLLANYVDASNYVFCEYDAADNNIINIQLKQNVHGYITSASPVLAVPVTSTTGISASIAVSGTNGTCSLGTASVSNEGIGAGKTALTATQSGGIGFAVSDANANVSHIIVREVSVRPL